MNTPCQNTDREIWRRKPGDFYSPSIYVTQSGGIGMNCHGHVIVAPLEKWHHCAEKTLCVDPSLPHWRYWLAMWLLKWDEKIKYPPC